jgi:hypothetical protein
MDNRVKTSEQEESSATWASDKGSCSEAPVGAAEQNQVEKRSGDWGGTPVHWRRTNRLWQVPLLVFRLTCNIALLLLEFLLEQ